MYLYQTPNEIILKSEVIATKIYEFDVKKYPKLSEFKDKYIQDTRYTIRFLSISLDMDEPLIFVNYMKWFGQLSYYLNFSLESMKNHFRACIHMFNTIIEPVLNKTLMDTYHLGIEQYEKTFLSIKPTEYKVDKFLDYLIHMNSDKAYEYVLKKIEEGMDLKDIYLKLFQPTLYQVGELWQQRIISVAKEHYITAAIQHIIGKLYPLLFNDIKHSNFTMTAVCPGEELHEIGMRMVADFFELSGWDTYFLGSNLPVKLIVDHLEENPTQLLAISATTPSQLMDVKSLIRTVRDHSKLKDIIILVGGRVFNDTPNLWKSIGADGYALEPEQAVQIATLLVGEANVK